MRPRDRVAEQRALSILKDILRANIGNTSEEFINRTKAEFKAAVGDSFSLTLDVSPRDPTALFYRLSNQHGDLIEFEGHARIDAVQPPRVKIKAHTLQELLFCKREYWGLEFVAIETIPAPNAFAAVSVFTGSAGLYPTHTLIVRAETLLMGFPYRKEGNYEGRGHIFTTDAEGMAVGYLVTERTNFWRDTKGVDRHETVYYKVGKYVE